MNKRITRVNELLKRELGQDLQREYQFKDALIAIHEVDVTPDLKSAQVFLGVVGSEQSAKDIVSRLNHDRGAIQNRLAKRVVLKFTPRLHFRFDDSVERGVHVVDLLDSLTPAADAPGAAEDTGDGAPDPDTHG